MTTKKEKRERGAEWQYRKGFRHGVAEAARLEAHHIEPVAEGGLSELDNLTTLCKEYHRG